MLANLLIAAFVTVFVAVVAYGHVLLITAIWPDLFRSRRPSAFDGTVETTQSLPQPK